MKPRGYSLVETLLTVALIVLTLLLATTIFVNEQHASVTAERYDGLLADSRALMDRIAQTIRTNTVDYAAYQDPNRNGQFDAGEPVDLSTAQTVLRLIGVTGVRTTLTVGTDGSAYECIQDPAAGDAITKCDQAVAGSNWIPLTTSATTITLLNFSISPASSPSATTARNGVDCASTGQFSSALGACTCTGAGAGNCLPDQLCVSTDSTAGISICRPDPSADSLQPRVTVILNARTKAGQVLRSPMETTVTSRVYTQ